MSSQTNSLQKSAISFVFKFEKKNYLHYKILAESDVLGQTPVTWKENQRNLHIEQSLFTQEFDLSLSVWMLKFGEELLVVFLQILDSICTPIVLIPEEKNKASVRNLTAALTW